MKKLALAALLLAGCSHAHHDVTISIDVDAVQTARDVAARDRASFAVVEVDGNAAILTIDERELPALSQAMHAEHHRCGGYIVEDSVAAAHASLVARDPGKGVDYSIDRPDVVGAVLPELDADKIRGTIAELSSMKNRYYESPTGVATPEWIRARWRSLAPRADVTIALVGDKPQKSIVLTIPGTTRASEVVVIGGHLDSITWPRHGDTVAPGADDDASGIATETEVLRALMAKGYRPERTIQFIGYAAEEVGLRGSQALVADYKKRGVNVVGAIQLDMTNYQGSDKDIWLMKDFTSAPQNAFLAKLIDTYVGATYGFDACGYACSDHASWFRAGVPASMPFEARSREYNKTIHTAEDTLETSANNARHAIKFAKLAAAYAIEMGKGSLN